MSSYLPFREYHLFQLLERFEAQALPLDLFISHYFRDHKSLGSKDRAFITESIYGMVRWLKLIDALAPNPPSWPARFSCYQKLDIAKASQDVTLPLPVRVSFPEPLLDRLIAAYGEEKAVELCLTSNTPAPATVRINTRKSSREALLAAWQRQYEVSPCPEAPHGIVFHKKIHFFSLPEFQKGLFEIQDEASQLVAALVEVKPKQQVLDYCAGSGGKTLAFAPGMQNRGQIFLHDIRPGILQEARRRLRRAGIQNAQVILPDSPVLAKLKKQMHWVLVDAPCSGTGTLRRNPDMKWKFCLEDLQRLQGEQRVIFEKALSFVKPGGHIVYATCSLLREENQAQVEHFIHTYGLTLTKPLFQTFPTPRGMDGFFAAVFQKIDKN